MNKKVVIIILGFIVLTGIGVLIYYKTKSPQQYVTSTTTSTSSGHSGALSGLAAIFGFF